MPEMSDLQKSMVPIDHMFKRKKEKNDKPEQVLQKWICSHLKDNYPGVYFQSDPLGLPLPNWLKFLVPTLQSDHSHLDLSILKRSICKNYCGLILELKADSPYLKNGELKKQPIYKKTKLGIRVYSHDHIQEQYKSMTMLRSEGYRTEWCWSKEMAEGFFIEYLGKPARTNEPLFP